MALRYVTLLLTAAVAACAGGGQATPGDTGDRVTVVVSNEYDAAVTAYVVWPGGRRARLGDVQPRRTRTFDTARAGAEIALGVVLTNAPPPVTGGGPTGFQGGAPPRINPEMITSGSILISPGDGIAWQITSTGSLLYDILEPQF